jgi:LysM repeat protein
MINESRADIRTQIMGGLLLVFIFTMIGFVALRVVTGNNPAPIVDTTAPTPDSAPAAVEGTPNPQDTIDFKHTALGFSLQYPRAWRKQEKGLSVIFSPSGGGLDPANLHDAAIWFGIPADSASQPEEVLAEVLQHRFPDSQTMHTGALAIGGEPWVSVQIRYTEPQFGPAIATIAAGSKNQVGYYVIATAPAAQWDQLQPTFAALLNSFRFTSEAVLRPTDATPPPTPTPTPTPIFHIIQSGDTLSHVSVKFGVSIEAIMDRNGLDKTSILHPGDKLIIPRPRKR